MELFKYKTIKFLEKIDGLSMNKNNKIIEETFHN